VTSSARRTTSLNRTKYIVSSMELTTTAVHKHAFRQLQSPRQIHASSCQITTATVCLSIVTCTALVTWVQSLAKRARKDVKGVVQSCTVSNFPKVVSMISELFVVRRVGSRGTREWVADSRVDQAGSCREKRTKAMRTIMVLDILTDRDEDSAYLPTLFDGLRRKRLCACPVFTTIRDKNHLMLSQLPLLILIYRACLYPSLS
jgi:hypothetical protein